MAGRGLSRPILFVCLLAWGLMGEGCYDPRVKSGQLSCPGGQCPDGFACSSGGLCVTSGAGGVGGRSGTGGGGAGGSCPSVLAKPCPGGAGGPGGAGVSTIPGCDPVCQTRCACGLTCGLDGTGTAFACTLASGVKQTEGMPCTAADDCAAGLLCLRETCGTNLRRCHRACLDNSVCDTVCNPPPDGIALPGGVKACGIPAQSCDPYGLPGSNGCPDPALYCITDGNSNTFCDCPVAPAGGGSQAEGAPCSGPAYCAAGLGCLRPPSADMARCFRLCKPTSTPTSTCACMAFLQVGYCPLASTP